MAGCSLPGSSGSPPPSPSPQPTPSGIPAADKNGPQEVAATLFPASGSACGHGGDYVSCPLSRELAGRLSAKPVQYVDQICRCSGPYHSPRFTVTPVADGAVVKVDLALEIGQQSLDLTLGHPQGVWVATDITCSGRGTSTSVFSEGPTLCFGA